ncbi:MAG: GNAT family N-acetyltransferase [Flavobacteriaceae bacterium]|jgi:putative acetyltransferase|nr:GNAT family N-acetyltransferase [Flavobacteriaceae bacterium]MDG1912758.1 GNAT family N-acetyltransferase [Flavobacteriaceae bacterium]
MHIRPIKASDDKLLALAIRSVLIEMGVPKTGTAYEDKELDFMFETYSVSRAIYYIVYEGESILGGAGIAPLKEGDPSVCELQKMYFTSQARGKGLGHQMIKKCLDFAKTNDFELCYIETMPNMKAAQKLYKKMGFEYIDHPMGNTGHGSCPIWMTKTIV